ncbi:MAG TPA: ATP phosphoribosyltransferase [Candidatus Methanoculleus thermohydrogenotrophicum]|jgi:ATP phosphoribosyltransferase|nr:ATP phosphoribosyltransferase [Candidatus Methanoculleus thermohydrogenotrophicum]NLM82542.1 ATP phosphoribosyltransferase [Candidatus Methanoculleus thermohydrogenotrophicum]HOB17404.1 ATP phosphoribosyltransferase [Candidatus Methanoculleus thermohydrogenotrophicum]HPZ37608.1 ATP phosphoribosyltransferase [Candidatus Methanoculleus thermohydrogenotrophicum]HQC90652.1 ATP phosphoribosyltransferase [Candidatus Methanoculleus thermohydrogenotrophicum]
MITIALPKGSLEAQTFQLFKEANLEVRRTDRDYNPRIDDPRIGKVKILRPQEIPLYVQMGYFDLGISGLDWVQESGADVAEIANLSYSKTGDGNVRIVVAVHRDEPIDDVSAIRPGSRVTTEYPRITERFFKEIGIPVRLFASYGASEAKVPDLMDVVVDLTETGSTLKKNGLKIIGQIMESHTALLANHESLRDPEKRKAIEEIATLLLGVIEARHQVLLTMNVPSTALEQVIEVLPAMKKPTVSRLHGIDYFSIQTVVQKGLVNGLIPHLKDAGAEDILEIPITKIVR